MHDLARMHRLILFLAMPVAAGCAGDGSSFSAIEASVVSSCGSCHDSGGFERLVDEVLALEAQLFDEDRFPDEMFQSSLRRQSTADLIAGANPERDATIDPATPDRKAWILHLLYQLDEQLRAEPSSDFTTEAAFTAYNAAGSPPSGCTVISRVEDSVQFELPNQMPPLWSDPLFEALGRSSFAPLGSEDRTALVENVEAGLPNGRLTCLIGLRDGAWRHPPGLLAELTTTNGKQTCDDQQPGR